MPFDVAFLGVKQPSQLSATVTTLACMSEISSSHSFTVTITVFVMQAFKVPSRSSTKALGWKISILFWIALKVFARSWLHFERECHSLCVPYLPISICANFYVIKMKIKKKKEKSPSLAAPSPCLRLRTFPQGYTPLERGQFALKKFCWCFSFFVLIFVDFQGIKLESPEDIFTNSFFVYIFKPEPDDLKIAKSQWPRDKTYILIERNIPFQITCNSAWKKWRKEKELLVKGLFSLFNIPLKNLKSAWAKHSLSNDQYRRKNNHCVGAVGKNNYVFGHFTLIPWKLAKSKMNEKLYKHLCRANQPLSNGYNVVQKIWNTRRKKELSAKVNFLLWLSTLMTQKL